jgi:hypothetical protein
MCTPCVFFNMVLTKLVMLQLRWSKRMQLICFFKEVAHFPSIIEDLKLLFAIRDVGMSMNIELHDDTKSSQHISEGSDWLTKTDRLIISSWAG